MKKVMDKLKAFQAIIASVVFMGALVAGYVQFQNLPSEVRDIKIKLLELEKSVSTLNTKVELNEKRIDHESLNKDIEDVFK